MPRHLLLSRYFVGLLIAFSVANSQAQPSPFRLPAGITSADYVPGMVVVKMAPVSSHDPRARLSAASGNALTQLQKICPQAQVTPIVSDRGPLRPQARAAAHPLANIYRVATDDTDVVELINRLQKAAGVVYAEPYYLLRPLNTYVPNDPSASQQNGEQDYLATVRAYKAWAIERGNADIVMGILDTGVAFGHQDLTDNLFINRADPINGVDDDQDGYIDNYVGWDMADHDNDPTADASGHGSLVAGVAAATPNNGVGIAGAGFHTSYMPIKIFRSSNGKFAFGYEAIAYAADRGCQVINLSWGGANAYSQFGEDIINYAVLERDAVIVAAAGNSGKEEKFYPASYDRVLSVAVTDAQDQVVGQTTYNHWIDMVAPGDRNYSTGNQDRYQYASGSSFAAPLVAGAAALVRARYPHWSAEQVMQQLRLSSDDIYAVGSNRQYSEKLGRGRLNMARALEPLASPAIRATSFTYTNHAGQHVFYGDTLALSATFKNYLSATDGNVTISLSTESPFVTLLDSVSQLGPLDSLATAQQTTDAFRMHLHEDLPADEVLVFRLGISAGAYRDYQYISFPSSPAYANVDNDFLTMVVGSNGDLGYNPTAVGPQGLQTPDEVLASPLGLMIATGPNQVSDNTIESYRLMRRGQDFAQDAQIKFIPSPTGVRTLRSVFTDALAAQPVGVAIEQTWLADTSAPGQSTLVGEYRITNTSDQPLNNLRVGMFADWELGTATENRAAWDAAHRLGYVYDQLQQRYAGVALLTPHAVNHRAIDRQGLNGNEADTEGEFTDAVKYNFLSTPKSTAGTAGAGNDVAHVVGATVAALEERQAEQVGFALVFGRSLADIQQAVQQAQALYDRYRHHPARVAEVQICDGQRASVSVPNETQVRFYRDPLGEQFLNEGASHLTNPITRDTVVYAAPVRDGYEARIVAIPVKIVEPVAAFSGDGQQAHRFANDTLFLDETNDYTLHFRDKSTNASVWQWDFGNGFGSRQQHPVARYDQPGQYAVSLTVSSRPGCTHTITKTLTVVRRGPRPLISDQVVCAGESVTLTAENTSSLAVYLDTALTQRVFTGSRYVSPPITSATDFYVVNTAEEIYSIPRVVRVRIPRPQLTIGYALDTVDINQKYLLHLRATGDTVSTRGLTWRINGQDIGSERNVSYNYAEEHAQGASVRVQLTYVQDSAGNSCLQQLSEEIVLSPAPAPRFSSLSICQGESAVLQPSNGKLFYFYRDKAQDSLVHKGRQLRITATKMDQTFYVTNMSGLLESEPVAIDVVLNSFADFHMSADTLFLSEGNEAVFEAFAEGDTAVSWQWDLGDGEATYRGRRVIQRYESPGTYRVQLRARTADGCTNTVARTLVVARVTGLRRDEDESFRVYPNPTAGEIQMENRLWFQKDIGLRLYDLRGQELINQELFYDAFPLTIRLRELANAPLTDGLYLLHVYRGDRVFVRKVYLSPQ